MSCPYSHFTSDMHYGHEAIISFCDRGFADVFHQTEVLISNYNKLVSPEDTCLWVGDCFFLRQTKAKEIMRRLNGKKHLVTGNHDNKDHKMLSLGFELVVEQLAFRIDGKAVRACHYPYWSEKKHQEAIKNGDYFDDRYKDRRPKRNDEEILIHGHTHSNLKYSTYNGKQIHVGVDAWEYAPATLKEIEDLIEAKFSNVK